MDSSNNASLRRRTQIWLQIVLIAALAVGGFFVVQQLLELLLPVVIALTIAYFLDPLVHFLETKFQLRRSIATVLLFFHALVLFLAFIMFVVPVFAREIQIFAEIVRESVLPWVRNTAYPWLTQYVTVPETFSGVSSRLSESVDAWVSPLGDVATRVIQGAASFVGGATTILLLPVFVCYFLPNFRKIVLWVCDLVPPRHRDGVRDLACDVDRALSAWVRGQMLVVVCLSVAYAVGLSWVGLRMGVLIGVVTGILAIVPYVGFALGLCVALLVCLVESASLVQVIGTCSVFGVVQLVDGLFLTPRLVGGRTGLGPVGVLVALLVGGGLFGFWGVLVAVPTACVLAVVAKSLIERYRSGAWFLGDASTVKTPSSRL